jgi:hypothetical protein
LLNAAADAGPNDRLGQIDVSLVECGLGAGLVGRIVSIEQRSSSSMCQLLIFCRLTVRCVRVR